MRNMDEVEKAAQIVRRHVERQLALGVDVNVWKASAGTLAALEWVLEPSCEEDGPIDMLLRDILQYEGATPMVT